MGSCDCCRVHAGGCLHPMGCRQWQDLFLYLAFDAGKFIYGVFGCGVVLWATLWIAFRPPEGMSGFLARFWK